MVPTSEPLSLIAGDTLKWTRSFPDYPASSGWALKYSLRNATDHIELASEITASGSAFSILVPAATSALWRAGTYMFYGYVVKGLEQYTVSSGEIQILPKIAAQAADLRSHNRKVLDSINAMIEGSSDVQEYTIGGRNVKVMTRIELLQWQQTYARRVMREEGRGSATSVARFSRAN